MSENRLSDYLDHIQQAATDAPSGLARRWLARWGRLVKGPSGARMRCEVRGAR